DRREVPHLERLRWRRREALHEGRALDEHHVLLGDRDAELVLPSVLRDHARREVPPDRLPRRRADRVRDLPEGDRASAPQVGREHVPRRALDSLPERRPLRRARGAEGARRGRPRVLPPAPLEPLRGAIPSFDQPRARTALRIAISAAVLAILAWRF